MGQRARDHGVERLHQQGQGMAPHTPVRLSHTQYKDGDDFPTSLRTTAVCGNRQAAVDGDWCRGLLVGLSQDAHQCTANHYEKIVPPLQHPRHIARAGSRSGHYLDPLVANMIPWMGARVQRTSRRHGTRHGHTDFPEEGLRPRRTLKMDCRHEVSSTL